MRLDVGVPRPADHQRRRHVDHRVGLHEAVLERPRQRDQLVRRAGLEQVGQRTRCLARVRDVRGDAAARAVDRRHREHVAVGDVDHDGHAAVRLGRLHLVEQRLLGLPLQRLVEREHDVGAALGVGLVRGGVGDVVAERVLLDDELARLAREQRVVLAARGRRGPTRRRWPADERAGERARG